MTKSKERNNCDSYIGNQLFLYTIIKLWQDINKCTDLSTIAQPIYCTSNTKSGLCKTLSGIILNTPPTGSLIGSQESIFIAILSLSMWQPPQNTMPLLSSYYSVQLYFSSELRPNALKREHARNDQ